MCQTSCEVTSSNVLGRLVQCEQKGWGRWRWVGIYTQRVKITWLCLLLAAKILQQAPTLSVNGPRKKSSYLIRLPCSVCTSHSSHTVINVQVTCLSPWSLKLCNCYSCSHVCIANHSLPILPFTIALYVLQKSNQMSRRTFHAHFGLRKTGLLGYWPLTVLYFNCRVQTHLQKYMYRE